MDPLIRPEQEGDSTGIYELHSKTFGRTNEGKLVNNLRGDLTKLSLVCFLDNMIVGHILYSEIEIHDENKVHRALALGPMAIHPDHQRVGIGKKLINMSLERLSRTKFSVIVVLGHKEYYPKFGFEKALKYGIKPPFDVESDYWMIYAFKKDLLGEISGIVKYPEAFDSV